MKYDEFVELTRYRSGLDTRKQAEGAIRATLVTLAERLVGYEAQNLAQQLPEELRYYLRTSATVQYLSVEEFIQRVAQRESVDLQSAVRHARAVLSVIDRGVSEEEMAKLRSEFPEGFRPLFATDSEGEVEARKIFSRSEGGGK